MKRYILTILIFLTTQLFSNDLLQEIDNAFFPVKEFEFQLELNETKNGKIGKPVVYRTYSYPPDKCILIAKKPAIMAGNSTLRINDTIFVYTKKIDKMSQYSAKVAFNGSLFTQEDILNSMFSHFYSVESSEEVEYHGRDALKVTLVGKNRKVAYKTLIFYVDPQTLIPIAREYFSYSGKLIKRITIDEVTYKDGLLTYLKLTMHDLIRTNITNTAEFTNIQYKSVPKKYFTKNYMKVLAR